MDTEEQDSKTDNSLVVTASSTQLTPLVGTAAVHTVSNIPNLTVAPNASIQLISPVPASTPSGDRTVVTVLQYSIYSYGTVVLS